VAALASTPALGAFLGSDIAAADQVRAALVLNQASKAIRNYCGWTITQETLTGAAVDGNGRQRLWLPTLLLTAVAEVVLDGRTLVYDVDYQWTSDGMLYRPTGWPHTPRILSVTYTQGYEAVPDDVAGVCLSIAARRFENPVAYRRESLDDWSVTHADKADRDMTEIELATLGPYRIMPL